MKLAKKKIIKLAVNAVLIVVLIAALILGNKIVFTYSQEISTLLSPAIVDEETMEQSSASGQAMSRRIVEEGAVLLKNENDCLPLDAAAVKQINVFGWRSVDWIYGSEGPNASGGVAPEDDDFNKNIDICKALNTYGVQYNRRLYDMYCSYYAPDHQSANLKGQHISNLVPLREPKITDKAYYSDDLLSYSKQYSDVAIVVIGRMAGEGMNARTDVQLKKGPGAVNDNSKHYLEISDEEKGLLEYCGKNFEKVIVVLNVANPFECGFLNTIEGIDACLYVGFTGTRGAEAIPKLLYGDVSPSGRTVDTFPYDAFTNPGNVFLNKTYTDNETEYMDIVENIYIGYKWYETADAEGVWDDYENGYNDVVQFPFGHGKSYTTFDWTVKGFYLHEDEKDNEEGEEAQPEELAVGSDVTSATKIDVVVNVKNTGNFRGRDVVEAYVTAPYTGRIEKAFVSLVAYNKTNILEPGADEDITLTIDCYDFASYDCYDLNKNGNTGYELEAGKYTIKLMTDSHNVKQLTAESEEEDASPVYAAYDFNVAETELIKIDPVSKNPVDNLFTGASTVDAVPLDANSKDGSYKADIPWFTRSAFTKPSEWAAMNVKRAITPDAVNAYKYTVEEARAWDNAAVDEFGNAIEGGSVTWGKNNNLKLAVNGIITELGKKLGADYGAEEWDDVLDQITYSEFTTLVNGYYSSAAINSVGKPELKDLDGPAQIKGFNYAPRGTGYPTMTVLAATWNPNLAYEFGKAFGDDMKSVGVSGLWGWAIDSHRSAFFGRNHESPSEDAHLAGKTVSNAVKGLNTRGRYCFLKHFAVYGYASSDANNGNNVWMTEQTLREIYIKPFRMAFLEGGALGTMTTYHGVGGEHSETTVGLITGVLRNEWGFKGAVTTDYIHENTYCDAIIRSGGNLGMGCRLSFGGYDSSASPRLQRRMRESVKQVLYVWLHADYNARQYALNPDASDTVTASSSILTWSWWQPLVYTLDVCVAVGCALWATLIAVSVFMPDKKKEAEADENAEPAADNKA